MELCAEGMCIEFVKRRYFHVHLNINEVHFVQQLLFDNPYEDISLGEKCQEC